MRRLVFACCAAAIVLGASPARGDDIDNEACLACHGVEDAVGADGKPIAVGGEAFAASVHAALACTTCHAEVVEIPHPEQLQPVDTKPCAACHSEVSATYEQSAHGKARANGASEAATCTSCHGPAHAIRSSRDPASPVYALSLPRTCGACHGDPALAARHDIPVVDAYQLYMDSIHGRALTRSGLLVAANCSSCHGTHEIRPKNDPRSKVYRASLPATCGACHAGVTEEYLTGVHGQAFAAGKAKAPVCVDCHSAHEIKRVESAAWQLGVVGECGTCHDESLRTYSDTFHGQVTALGFTAVAGCADCHESHRVLPASDARSSIAASNRVATCRKCHPAANENFAMFAPHADPGDRDRNPGLYYAARLMDLLIAGVFAFFGLHTALWLSRGMFRRPARDGDEDDPEPGEAAE